MRLTKILMVGMVPLALAFGCGGTASDSGDGGDGDGDGDASEASSSADGKEDECEAFCTQLQACDGVDFDDCNDSCASNSTTSEAGQVVLNDCFDADLCEADLATDGTAELLCLIGGATDIEISDEADTYCNESVDAINACLADAPVESDIPGSCEDTIGLASDELLESLNECATRDCENVQTCLELAAVLAVGPSLIELEAGADELSPATVANLLPVLIAFSNLGLGGEFLGEDPSSMGGAGGL